MLLAVGLHRLGLWAWRCLCLLLPILDSARFLLATRATSIVDTRFIHGFSAFSRPPTRDALPAQLAHVGLKRPQRATGERVASCGVGGLGDVSVGASGAETFGGGGTHHRVDVCTWWNAHRARRTDQPATGVGVVSVALLVVASRRTCPTLGHSGVGGGVRLAVLGRAPANRVHRRGWANLLRAVDGGRVGHRAVGLGRRACPVAHRATTCPHLATHPTGGAERGLIPDENPLFQLESVCDWACHLAQL